MAFSKAIEAVRVRAARIQDGYCKSWIREERENPVFPFPGSVKSRIGLFAALSKLMAFLKAIEAGRVRAVRIQDGYCKSWIREERENHVFPFPGSVKSRIGLFATI